MYSPVHATAGFLLAQFMPNPLASFAVGVASHYLLDRVPHGDTAVGTWLTARPTVRLPLVELIDLGGAAVMIGWLVTRLPSPDTATLLAGAIGGITPDLLWGGRYLLGFISFTPKWLRRLLDGHQKWHEWIHAKAPEDIEFLPGVLVQLAAVLAVVLFYF